MDKHLVFSKSARGREALSGRPAGLGPRLRSLLIMVDGKRSVAEFDQLLGTEASPLLEQLLAEGWVEGPPAPAPTPPPSGAAPAGGPAAPSGAPLPFGDARRLVVRFVNDRLGPLGEPLALRIEACKTPADLRALLPRVREGLRLIRNAAAVAQFDQEVVPRLPA